MLQALLKERFKLSFHMESKDITGYFLVPASGGPKLKQAPDTPPDRQELARKMAAGIKPFPVQSGELSGLVRVISNQLRSPVIDQTGISGRFDYSSLDGVDFGGGSPSGSDTSTGSIFAVLPERLGLKLEPHKIPVQIFVIEHAEKPPQD